MITDRFLYFYLQRRSCGSPEGRPAHHEVQTNSRPRYIRCSHFDVECQGTTLSIDLWCNICVNYSAQIYTRSKTVLNSIRNEEITFVFNLFLKIYIFVLMFLILWYWQNKTWTFFLDVYFVPLFNFVLKYWPKTHVFNFFFH